jgi:hypothetical protein
LGETKLKHLEEYYTTFMLCLLATDSPVISKTDMMALISKNKNDFQKPIRQKALH